MYKAVLMDADDTLLDYGKAEEYAIRQTFKDFGFFDLRESDGHIQGYKEESFSLLKGEYSIINGRLWKELEEGKVTKEELRIRRFSELFERNNLNYKPDEFSSKYIQRLSEGTFLLEGAIELCGYLKKKYMTAIVTNGIKEVQYPRIENSMIGKYIDWIVVSDDAGVSKPSPEIFQYTMDILNSNGNRKIKKEEVIILGDSLTADIQGGINFGIDTCWINLGKKVNQMDIKPKYTVTDYSELYKLL